MDKLLKNIVNKTIEREYDRASEDFWSALKKNGDLLKAYEMYSKQVDEISEQLSKVVPTEYIDLIGKLVDVTTASMCVEGKMLFKEGVTLGATELSYLGELGGELQFI